MLTLTGCWCIECISPHRRKEAQLKEQLYTIRHAIDQFTQHKNAAPQSLEDLVRTGYLHELPTDPFTNSNRTWTVIQEDILSAVDPSHPGISDVHSGSKAKSSDGTPYSSW